MSKSNSNPAGSIEYDGFHACPVENCVYEHELSKGISNHMCSAHSDEERQQAMIDDLHRVAEIVDRSPKTTDVEEHGHFSYATYIRNWGSFPAARKAAGFDPGGKDSRNQEVLELVYELIDEGKTDDLGGGVATATVVDAMDSYSRREVSASMSDLAEEGHLKRVRGIGPSGVRDSFLPAEMHDGRYLESPTKGGHA